MSTVKEVEVFLEQLRYKIKTKQGLTYINRHKNSQTLLMLQMKASDRTPIILSLEANNYSAGPLPDHYGGTAVWVFGTLLQSLEIYIKVTLKEEQNNCLCISFHIADYPMNYPLR